jgi:integrase
VAAAGLAHRRDAGDVRETVDRCAEGGREAGVDKRVHPHGLRHTLTAELVAEGQPITVIRDQLGLSSLAVTDRYLRNVAPGSVIAAMQKRDWTEPGVGAS